MFQNCKCECRRREDRAVLADGAVQYHADGARNPKRFACRLTKERADAFGRKVSFALATGGRPRSTLRKVAAPTCANHEINRFAANVL
jgi:hypothetical protein